MNHQDDDNPSDDDDPPQETVLEAAQAVRVHVHGQTALLITNRREPNIEDKLAELVGLQVSWVDSNQQRRLQSAKKSIQAGSCDYVLVSTRFVGHNVDYMLKGACKRGDVPFICVNKGRPAACVLALADWLSSGTNAVS